MPVWSRITIIVEREEEMRQTQQLLNGRMQQMESVLNELHRVNRVIEQLQEFAIVQANI